MRPDINEVLARREAAAQVPPTTGNVALLLNEVRHALARLVETGEATAIDLRRVPLTEGDEIDLENALGHGEVSAKIDSIGGTVIRETRYSGVWRVTHHDTEGTVLAELIEVTRMPEILMSQRGDIQTALRRMTQNLAGREAREVTQ